MIILNADSILRYLLEDHFDTAMKTRAKINRHKVLVPFEVLSEVVYVLEQVYRIDRRIIADTLDDFMSRPNIQTNDKSVLSYALKRYAKGQSNFVDGILDGYCQLRNYETAVCG